LGKQATLKNAGRLAEQNNKPEYEHWFKGKQRMVLIITGIGRGYELVFRSPQAIKY